MTLSSNILNDMAKALEVSNPDDISKLRKRVEAAISEYHINTNSQEITPKDLQQTFNSLNSTYRELYDTLRGLGEKEREILNKAASEYNAMRPPQDWIPDADGVPTVLKKIGILIRMAPTRLPRVSPGRPKDIARQRFVERLGIIYMQSKHYISDEGNDVFPFPTRCHDVIEHRDYGAFRDFVILAFTAIGIPDPTIGVDDLIRPVTTAYKKNVKTWKNLLWEKIPEMRVNFPH